MILIMIACGGLLYVCHHIVKPSVPSSYMALHDIFCDKIFYFIVNLAVINYRFEKTDFTNLFSFLFGPQPLHRIKTPDTLFNKQLEEVIVTTTRTERKLGNIAIPVKHHFTKNIQQAASLRLKRHFAGAGHLFITSGFGANDTDAGVWTRITHSYWSMVNRL